MSRPRVSARPPSTPPPAAERRRGRSAPFARFRRVLSELHGTKAPASLPAVRDAGAPNASPSAIPAREPTEREARPRDARDPAPAAEPEPFRPPPPALLPPAGTPAPAESGGGRHLAEAQALAERLLTTLRVGHVRGRAHVRLRLGGGLDGLELQLTEAAGGVSLTVTSEGPHREAERLAGVLGAALRRAGHRVEVEVEAR